MNFGQALERLRAGHRVAREGWNGEGMWLEFHFPDAGGLMTLPYIYMKTVQGDLVPWVASQTDLLLGDWFVCSQKSKKDQAIHDAAAGMTTY